MPDIHFIEEGDSSPMYDLIIGLETLVQWKAILNLYDNILTIDHVALPMQDLHSLDDPKLLNNIYTESTEPSVSRVTSVPDVPQRAIRSTIFQRVTRHFSDR